MKRFAFRLWLIHKLIESTMWSCMDEYDEMADVCGGLAHAHWEIDQWFDGKVAPPMQGHRHNAVNVGPLPGGGYQPKTTVNSHSVVPPTGGSGTVRK